MEEAPLLDQVHDESIPPRPSFQARSSRVAILIFAFIIFCLALGGSLAIVPTTKLLEDILCYHYYENKQKKGGNISETLCKVDAIQSELAYLRGLLSTLEAVIGTSSSSHCTTKMLMMHLRTMCRSSLRYSR
jgi:PCFT/HCP family folate transporter-like MFS transporter 1/3